MKIIKNVSIIFLLLGALFLLGPRVDTPKLEMDAVEVPSDLIILNNWIKQKENALGNVRCGNASRIIFNDSLPQKTKYSVLYLHGFTASGMEGDPVHRNIANALGANLYIPRLFGHGLDEDEPMLNFNNDAYWESAKESIAVAKQLGEEVILLGTSHGGSLSLSLGVDSNIKAICLFGPNIAVFYPLSKILSSTLTSGSIVQTKGVSMSLVAFINSFFSKLFKYTTGHLGLRLAIVFISFKLS